MLRSIVSDKICVWRDGVTWLGYPCSRGFGFDLNTAVLHHRTCASLGTPPRPCRTKNNAAVGVTFPLVVGSAVENKRVRPRDSGELCFPTHGKP